MLVSTGFQVLFHSPPGVLFTFPSQYYSLSVIRKYLGLDDGPPSFPPDFTCPAVLRIPLTDSLFHLQDSHLLRSAFPCCSIRVHRAKCGPYPGRIAPSGLASSAFARHYLRNLGWFLFLVLLRCFSSDGSPRMLIWLGIRCKGLTPCGLLHSDICGSFRACRSPQLFAAYRVLLRLLMPRHPSCALISLTYFCRTMSHRY